MHFQNGLMFPCTRFGFDRSKLFLRLYLCSCLLTLPTISIGIDKAFEALQRKMWDLRFQDYQSQLEKKTYDERKNLACKIQFSGESNMSEGDDWTLMHLQL